MNALKTVFFQTLQEGIENHNSEKLKEFIEFLFEEIEKNKTGLLHAKVEENKSRIDTQQSEIMKTLEVMETRFKASDQRFEDIKEVMETRFKAMDQRFEDIKEVMETRFKASDQRFEDIKEVMETRFKAMDQRFDAMQKSMDHRFDDMHKRITQQTWFIGSGFIIINAVIMLLKFFG